MPNIWDDENNELNNIIGKYNEWHSYMEKKDQAADPNNIINAPDEEPDAARQAEAAEKWKDFNPEEQRNRIIEILDKEKKSADYLADEREEMHFISETLKRGWLVSDIEMLRDLYGVVARTRPGEDDFAKQQKKGADVVLSDLTSRDVHTVPGRSNALKLIRSRISTVKDVSFPPEYRGKTKQITTPSGKIKEIKQHAREYFMNQLEDKPMYPEEYPDDRNFNRYLDERFKVPDKKGLTFSEISKEENRAHILNVLKEQKSDMGSFVPNIKSKDQIERERTASQPEGLWRTKVIGVKKSASAAVSEVLGNEVYEDIDEKHFGRMNRSIPLHKNNGTKNAKQGNDVIHMEFGGSMANGEYLPHKNLDAPRDEKTMEPEKAERIFGKKPLGPDGQPYEHVRHRSKTLTAENGKNVKKDRYIFPGMVAGGKILTLGGVANIGNYSIESARKHARFLMSKELKPKIDAWLAHKKDPEHNPDPMINPTMFDSLGYSRGAATAGQAPKQVDSWITKYMKEQGASNEQIKEFKEEAMKYQALFIDAVPGFGTYSHMKTCTLTDIPNMDAVVRCSFGINQPDWMFPMQQINGANKLIFSVHDHSSIYGANMEVDRDNSRGDNRLHRKPFFNAETGEMFQLRSLHDMPDGVYFEDEQMNIIRVNSYSQVGEMFKAVYGGSSPQASREKGIHTMARDWFISHELQSSFPDEITHRMEQDKFIKRANKLLQNDAKRLKPVQDALNALNDLNGKFNDKKLENGEKPSLKDLSDAHKNLIENCRNYLKNTGMPPRGDSAVKAGLVGDILSFSMREKNFFNKMILKNNPKLAEKYSYNPEMDNKIKAYNDRLEQKPGYLERKVAAEEKRIESLKKIQVTMSKMKKFCKDALKTLDQTRVGKSNSDSYNSLYSMLKKGTELSPKTSMNEFAEFCKDLREEAKHYDITHDMLFGPLTKDGKTRLKQSRTAAAAAKFCLGQAEEVWKEMQGGLNDRDLSVVDGMHLREKNVEYMKKKAVELRGAQPENEAEQKAPVVRNGRPARHGAMVGDEIMSGNEPEQEKPERHGAMVDNEIMLGNEPELNGSMSEEDILVGGSQKDQKLNAATNKKPAAGPKK